MKNKFTKLFTLIIASALILQGCAGKTPHPVSQYTPYDKTMSCEDITMEMNENQDKIIKFYPKTQKTGKNIGLGVAGAFLIVPWFFMDFSDAEKIEIEALKRRNQRLRLLASEKQCDANTLPKPIKFQKAA